MNNSRLAKHYGMLSVVERLRLIHDAGRRGDSVEQQRVRGASPRRHYSMLDTGRLENNLRICLLVYHSFQLATASEFWLAQTRVAWELDGVADNEPISDETQYWNCIAKLAEASYSIERDGCQLFFRQSGFDESRITVEPLASHWMLEYMDEHATVPPDFETAAQWLLSRNDHLRAELAEPLKLITPEAIANGWHRTVEEMTAL